MRGSKRGSGATGHQRRWGVQCEAEPVDRLDRQQFADADALLGVGPVQMRAA